jgi:hypothetical protein
MAYLCIAAFRIYQPEVQKNMHNPDYVNQYTLMAFFLKGDNEQTR